MQVIGVQQMLAHMERIREDGTPHEFTIIFVGGTRRNEGLIKEARCRKLGHAAGHNHRERGTIPLFHIEKQRPMTPFLDNIIFYNGMKVMA